MLGWLMGTLVFFILAFFAIIGLIFALRPAKYRCKGCSAKIDSTQVVCKHCGTFVETKTGSGKRFKGMENSVEGRNGDFLKKMERDK